jgi:DNA-binding transcriptional LysR family regulator
MNRSALLDNSGMETRRLTVLVTLARLGSMHATAAELRMSTSTVSQQIAALAREVGTPLTEPVGRRIRLTPAGARLAEHALRILEAVDAAYRDLDPTGPPEGVVRVASFASAIRSDILPAAARLARDHPRVHLRIDEHEPGEAYPALTGGQADLAITYDYDLAPATLDPSLRAVPLRTRGWDLATLDPDGTGGALRLFARHRDHDWIVNSRNVADETVIRTIASMAGFSPRVAHRADSLDLVADLVRAGLGVGLLPAGFETGGVHVHALHDPSATLRSYAVVRRGHDSWPPLALVLDLLTRAVDAQPADGPRGGSAMP